MNKFKDTRIYGQLIVDDSIIMDKAIVNSQLDLPYNQEDYVLKFKGLNYDALIRNIEGKLVLKNHGMSDYSPIATEAFVASNVPEIKTLHDKVLTGSGNVTLSKGDIGLDNVDNTSDANKPISTATQTALNLKADKTDIPKNTSELFNDSDFTTKEYVDDEIDGKIGDIDFSDFVKSVNEKTPDETGRITLTHEDVDAVPLSRKISGLVLNGDISEADLRNTLQEATNLSKGLMSTQDKTNLETLMALFDADDDTTVNTIAEILAIFENYPEGADLVTVLQDKIDKTSIVDNLTTNDATKVLSAKQGKVLNDTTAKLAVSNVFTQPQIVPNAENDDEAVNLGQLNTVVSIWRYE